MQSVCYSFLIGLAIVTSFSLIVTISVFIFNIFELVETNTNLSNNRENLYKPVLFNRINEPDSEKSNSKFRDFYNFTCGDSLSPNTARILGGNEARPNSYPWVVSLREIKNNALYDHFCGGVLISQQHVLTAAHCVFRLYPHQVRVVAGLHERTDISTYAFKNTYSVSKIITHEDYNNITTENDIAILVIENPVKLSVNITPICLPINNNSKTYFGKDSIVVGWGINDYFLPSSINLRQSSLTILNSSDSRCNNFLNTQSRDMLYCALDIKSGNKLSSPCSGDSGGPLFIKDSDNKWTLLGIVSYVQGYLFNNTKMYHCDPKLPSFYSSVPFYLNWIRMKSNVL